jgi:hypothetical protein
MSEQPSPPPPAGTDVRESLRQLTQLLREAPHLEPEAQESLAELVHDLGRDLDPASLSAEESAHLRDLVAHLTQTLYHAKHDRGLLAQALARLEDVALRAEAQAPRTTEIARRIMEVLANLGI